MAFFLIRNKIFFVADSASEEEIKQALFKAIQSAPSAEDIPDETEAETYLDPKSVYGAMEKDFIVLGANQTDGINKGGATGLIGCLGVAVYSRKEKKLAAAHLDIQTDEQSLEDLLSQFKDPEELEIRFFGGTPTTDHDKYPDVDYSEINPTSDGFESMKLAERIYYFLFKYAHTHKVKLNVLSSNTFDKLISYKKDQVAAKKNIGIGFLINVENGKVKLYKSSKNENLPYVTIPYCGLFSEDAKNGYVRDFLQTVWNMRGFVRRLMKQFDNSQPGWNADNRARLDKKSLVAVKDRIKFSLNEWIENAQLESHFNAYIEENWLKWIEEFSLRHGPLSYAECIVDYAVTRRAIRYTPVKHLAPLSHRNGLFFRVKDFVYKKLMQLSVLEKKSIPIPKNSIFEAICHINGLDTLINEWEEYINKKRWLIKDNLFYRLTTAWPVAYGNIVQMWLEKTLLGKIIAIVNTLSSECNYKLTKSDKEKLIQCFFKISREKIVQISLDHLILSDDIKAKMVALLNLGIRAREGLTGKLLKDLGSIYSDWLETHVFVQQDSQMAVGNNNGDHESITNGKEEVDETVSKAPSPSRFSI